MPVRGRNQRAKPKTSAKPGAKRRIDPHEADPNFLTEAEMDRRERFAQSYVIYGNKTRAAREAGFTGTTKSLNVTGSRLGQEPWVRARIKQLQDDIMAKLGITQVAVLSEYARIAFADIRRCFDKQGRMLPMSDIDGDTARALSGYEVTTKTFGSGDEESTIEERKIKMASKEAALAKLGTHLGMFKAENEGPRVSAEQFLAVLLEGRERARQGRQQGTADDVEGDPGGP